MFPFACIRAYVFTLLFYGFKGMSGSCITSRRLLRRETAVKRDCFFWFFGIGQLVRWPSFAFEANFAIRSVRALQISGLFVYMSRSDAAIPPFLLLENFQNGIGVYRGVSPVNELVKREPPNGAITSCLRVLYDDTTCELSTQTALT